MAFDAGMLAFVAKEINDLCSGGKVEKVYQPARDEFIFLVRSGGVSHRLLINAGSRCPRIGITEEKAENPAKAPMLCMMFRKHLQGAIFVRAEQLGFERAAKLIFDAYDDMGYKCEKSIVVEMMGKYSNIIFCDGDMKIINILRQIDISQSSKRVLLPGMIYEEPPKQDKIDPLTVDRETFLDLCAGCEPDRLCEKFIMSTFSGISPLVARELAARCAGDPTATVEQCANSLEKEFFSLLRCIINGDGVPTMVLDEKGLPKEYCFMPISQYGVPYTTVEFPTFGALLDNFFAKRAREEKISQKASDILKIVSAAETRIAKKLTIQKQELLDCEEGEKYRLWGDLITANIYRLKRGQDCCTLEDYNTGYAVDIPLDKKLTPAQNAQKYYKKYAKTKSAKEHLTKQIDISASELEYISTVRDALSRVSTEKELSEIRSELYEAGFASKMKQFQQKKQGKPSYLTFKTSGGYTVLCGKNNIANDWLTFKHAEKGDWWFHAKGIPGSHVIMEAAGLEEPSAEDFTEACMIAAVYSKAAESPMAEIDYTRVKQVKKPPNAKPGYVIYHTNWSANVEPDKKKVQSLLV